VRECDRDQGLYRVQPEDHLAVTDLVVVMASESVAGFLAERGYLAHGVPLLKQILALPGQTDCCIRLAIKIDGDAAAARKSTLKGAATASN